MIRMGFSVRHLNAEQVGGVLHNCCRTLNFDFVIHVSQILIFKLRVHLGGIQVRMPQQVLHPPQIKAAFDKLNYKAIPESVEMHIDTDGATILLLFIEVLGTAVVPFKMPLSQLTATNAAFQLA